MSGARERRPEWLKVRLPGGPECALVDTHGTLMCYSGAWAFGLGAPAKPLDLRIRTLRDGAIPIVEAACRVGELACRFVWFACEVPESPRAEYPQSASYQWVGRLSPGGRNLFLVLSGRLTNAGDAETQCTVTLGYSQQPGLCAG